MRRIVLLTLAFLVLLLSGCGGDGNGDDPPDDLPVFDGAQFDSGTSDESDGVSTFRGVWSTEADPPEVQQFFERALESEGWTIIDTITTEEAVVIVVEREVDGVPESGTVIIDGSEGETRIVPTIRRGRPQPPDNEPGEEVSLPPGYPDDRVPLPAGVTLVSVNGPEESGGPIYTVSFTSPNALPELASHWRDALGALGWQNVFDAESASEFTLQFEDSDGSVTLTGRRDGDDAAIGNVTLILR